VQQGEPVEIEQAFATAAGKLTLQSSAEYMSADNNGKGPIWEVGPEIEYGVMQGVQISVSPTYDFGASDQASSGAAETHLLYQFTDQDEFLPALAVDLSYASPYGGGDKTTEYGFRALASKWLGTSPTSPRIHLNLTCYQFGQPGAGERKDQLDAAAGGSFMLDSLSALVADVADGATQERHQDAAFIDIGYRRDFAENWGVSVGVGKQINASGPGLRVFFSVEREFRLF
jgi:hypothetical protein